MKKPVVLIILLLFLTSLDAQKLIPSDTSILKQKEDSLKSLAKSLIVDSLTA